MNTSCFFIRQYTRIYLLILAYGETGQTKAGHEVQRQRPPWRELIQNMKLIFWSIIYIYIHIYIYIYIHAICWCIHMSIFTYDMYMYIIYTHGSNQWKFLWLLGNGVMKEVPRERGWIMMNLRKRIGDIWMIGMGCLVYLGLSDVVCWHFLSPSWSR